MQGPPKVGSPPISPFLQNTSGSFSAKDEPPVASLEPSRGLFFQVDPASNPSLGGMAACGSSGTLCCNYGTMKDPWPAAVRCGEAMCVDSWGNVGVWGCGGGGEHLFAPNPKFRSGHDVAVKTPSKIIIETFIHAQFPTVE